MAQKRGGKLICSGETKRNLAGKFLATASFCLAGASLLPLAVPAAAAENSTSNQYHFRKEDYAAAGWGMERRSPSSCSQFSEGQFFRGRKPNIIFIMADDLGYGDLGCYGQEQIQTPSLDRMAAEGLRFTSAYAGAPVCAPSRSALMTGLHTGHTRVRGNAKIPLEEGDTTVAEVLQEAGYITGLVGKWGLGENGSTGIPNKKGFDYFYGYLNQTQAHNYYPEFLWRNREKVFLENKKAWWGLGASRVKAEYSHDILTEEALSFVEENKEGPFFLYLAYTIPHANSEARDGMEVPDYGIYDGEEWPNPQKGHAAMITRMDRDIGLLQARLQELGLAQNTLLIFTSDNGPHNEGGADPDFFSCTGPLTGIKRSLREGGIRMPAIAWWPGTIEPGRVSDHPWAFWDIMPTFAGLAGASPPDNIDGISFVPELLGFPDRQEKHEFLYWEFHHEIWASSQAVRMGPWKAIRSKPGAPLELYNLEIDLAEQNDVASEHAEIVSQIEEYLEGAREESKVWPLRKLNLFGFLISQLYKSYPK